MQFKRTNIPYSGRDKYQQTGNGNKYRKSSKTYGTGGGGYGGGTIGPMPYTGSTPGIGDVYSTMPASNINAADLSVDTPYEVLVPINGFSDNETTEVWIGTTNSADTNYGISGIPSTGMSVVVLDNGTTEPTLKISIYSTIPSNSGELRIPVMVNTSPYLENWGTSIAQWNSMDRLGKLTPKVVTYNWNIKSAGGGTGYMLDLTNENATVNADSNGNIYTASTATLQCQAILYYDSTAATGVTYSLSKPAGTTGVTINQSTGVLTFTPATFTFTGMSTNLTITATKGTVSMNKVMRITMVKDGAGSTSTSRWIVPNVYSIVKDIDGTLTPSTVTAVVMEQTGNYSPTVDTTTKIFYGWAPDHINPNIQMPGTGVAIGDNVDYLILAIRDGNTSTGTIYESETIPVISDGTGPAIRGPISWRSSLARRFSNGIGPQQQDRDFIDVVRYQAHSYRCINSYTQTTGSTWASVSENWELDDSYNFVASSIDLEQDAVIALKPTNQITFVNANNTTTGYINNTTIMMGGTNPSTAPVYINNSGQARLQNVMANGVVQSPVFQSDLPEGTVKAIMTPFKMQMMICTDDKSAIEIDQNTGNWALLGMDTEIPASDFPYILECDRETDQDHVGWWVASDIDAPGGNIRFIGAVSSNVERQPGIIYLNM